MSNDDSNAPTALVVDDHPIVRDALASVLTRAGYRVIASAATVPEALTAYHQRRPHLVLADLRLEETSERGRGREGIELARRLVEADPTAVVVIVSGRNDGSLVQEGLDAGAVGWVSKRANASELVEVLGDALRGVRGAHDRDTYRRLLSGVPADPQKAAGLSSREMDVLEAMARGATTTAQLAAALHISTDTVKTHVGTVLSKLEVPNRAAAIVRAHQLGLVHSRRDD